MGSMDTALATALAILLQLRLKGNDNHEVRSKIWKVQFVDVEGKRRQEDSPAEDASRQSAVLPTAGDDARLSGVSTAAAVWAQRHKTPTSTSQSAEDCKGIKMNEIQKHWAKICLGNS